MSNRAEQVSKWFYRGLWGGLTHWFKVPDRPPSLPAMSGESIRAFQPDRGFLRYLLFQFWIALLVIDGLIVVGWLVIAFNSPRVGAVLAIPALILAVLPDIVAYLAVHLRFDTTWYVISDRSLRIRRGIWTIREMTLTFENIQNVTVRQGPLQRYFGIANVMVETAGGGQSGLNTHGAKMASAHAGVIEGIADAPQIRDLILQHLRISTEAGLGDDVTPATLIQAWSPARLSLLREIRDAARAIPPIRAG